jgi:hypothetical protein
MIAFGPQPLDADVGPAAEQQDQLTGVVLKVAKVVEHELADVQLVPPEPAPRGGPFIGQLLERLLALP